jgi:hypothetical protein
MDRNIVGTDMLRGVKTERVTKIDVISGDIVGAGKGV